MAITKRGFEYLTFFEKIDLLEKVISATDDDNMKSSFELWLKEMNKLGHIEYPMDKFRGVEDL